MKHGSEWCFPNPPSTVPPQTVPPISETKLNHSFTTAQFSVDGYQTPFRKDRNEFGGGLMLFISKELICNTIPTPTLPKDIEAIFVELNLRNQKILLVGVYRESAYFVNSLMQQINILKYDKMMVILM